jgi:SdpI/YfhL protein family
MRKWMPAVLIAITYILSALMLPRLPAVVELDLRLLLPFDVEGESAPRAWMAFGIPTVALALWLLFLAATSRGGAAVQKRAFGRWAPPETLEPRAIARFRSTYDLVVALVIAFVLVFHLTLVALAAGGPPSTARGFMLLLGLGLAVMGNVMPRIRPNAIMGLRTRATLNDPLLWARMHRLFGGLLLGSGVLVMLLALLAVRYALIGFIGALLLSCLIVLGVQVSFPRRTGKAGAVLLFLLLCGLGSAHPPQGRPASSPPADIIKEAR